MSLLMIKSKTGQKAHWVFMMILISTWSCQPNEKIQLINKIENAFASEQGTFAMAFYDLQTGDSLLINAHEKFHAASTMKTPVMMEVYYQAAEGQHQLEDSIIIKNTFYSIVDSSEYQLFASDDSETSLYDQLGQKKRLSDLIYDMIIVSSNLATNLIIEKVGAPQVTNRMRILGAPDIEVLRGVEDTKAYEAGLSNRTTAYDLMKIFERLANKEVVSEQASEEMIEILKDQRFNDIIPAYLPEDVVVAHKTGSITGVHHDSGIIFLPDGRKYVLILLSKDLEDFDRGTQQLAQVSRWVYDYMQ